MYLLFSLCLGDNYFWHHNWREDQLDYISNNTTDLSKTGSGYSSSGALSVCDIFDISCHVFSIVYPDVQTISNHKPNKR